MLNVIGFQFLQWKTDVYNIPPIISVIQIGVVEVLLSFVNKYKNYQPVPYNIHIVWWFEQTSGVCDRNKRKTNI